MHVVKGQGHIIGSATNWSISFLSGINWPCHSLDTAI